LGGFGPTADITPKLYGGDPSTCYPSGCGSGTPPPLG